MKRILFAIPHGYHAPTFWTRDSGLVVLALREKGYDAWIAALDLWDQPAGDRPVILVSQKDLENPEWWQAQKPDAVVLCTWSAPRYDAVRQAALAGTPLVVERLDTDGVRSARLFPKLAYLRNWCSWSDRLPRSVRWLTGPVAFLDSALRFVLSPVLDAGMAKTMKRVRGLIAESPVAAERIRRILQASPGPAPEVVVIPHPVNEDAMCYAGTPKENRIVTVGRWASAQKDFPRMQRVVHDFLRLHPDWSATIVGSGIPIETANGQRGDGGTAGRISYHDEMSHADLTLEYGRSKIYLMASRYESFCIAAAEALCCGCSVVGSSYIASSYYFADPCSGTVAADRSPRAFVEALEVEAKAWAAGQRDPKAIAANWRTRAGNREVAQATLDFLNKVAP